MKLFSFALFSAALAFGDGAVDGSCSIEDYNNPNVDSWRTNCPDGCAIKEYMDEMEAKINDNWRRVQQIMDGSAERLGRINDHHVTLSQIKKLVKEAMETLKKERDQFEEIQKIY